MLQIMPNHLHGIIEIKNIEPGVGATPRGCPDNESESEGQPRGVAPTISFFDAINRFKTLTTKGMLTALKSMPDGHFPANYGSEIITSILFEMKKN